MNGASDAATAADEAKLKPSDWKLDWVAELFHNSHIFLNSHRLEFISSRDPTQRTLSSILQMPSLRSLFNRVFKKGRRNQGQAPVTQSNQQGAATRGNASTNTQHATPKTETSQVPTEQTKAQGLDQSNQKSLVPTQERVAATASTLTVSLVNQTSSSTVYTYITGYAINNNNALVLLQSDGQTLYYPTNPSSNGSPLQANCAIPLGPPGESVNCTIPQIAGGRVWFSVNSPITFLLNPSPTGPALVEPSVTNPSDPNINIQWDFCEFTFNSSQLYANISYVDFVSLPIGLQLTNISGAVQTVTGMPPTGLASVCSQLQAQTASDGIQGWSNCIVNYNGSPLRTLSPNQDLVVHPSDFSNYFEPYVSQVWSQYTSKTLNVNVSGMTSPGTVTSVTTSNGTTEQELVFNVTVNPSVGTDSSTEAFTPPTTADIFSCSTGPFATGSDATRNAIIAQLASAFNRTTLLETNTIPSPLEDFYKNGITNHYARIVHGVNVDGRGYAFPYDDVNPSDAGDQSGEVNDPNPMKWVIYVGGGQLS